MDQNTQTTATTQTRGERVNADLVSLLRARHTLLWVSTREELRVERALVDVCGQAQYGVRFWDCASGLSDVQGKPLDPNLRDPSAVLETIGNSRERVVYVLRDLHKWFDPLVLRALRNLAKSLQGGGRGEQRSVILLTPSSEVPPELAGHATVVDYPLPDRREIEQLLADVISSLPAELQATCAPNGQRDAAIDAAVGLTAEEAGNCYARSLVTSRKIDPQLVSAEKRRVIARERVLTWTDPDPRGLDAVGGLEVLKSWLRTRRSAFGARARAYGLQAPKGMLLVGPPGTGKSLVAKCVASAWGMPLLRLDLGALRSKYVGESEGNIRKALAVAETVAPCVLWIDEIEKALAGSSGPQGDGGVAADALGAVLSWMQEREGSVFCIATSNDVRQLPPELLRKGRFDEIFYVDLPTQDERVSVLAASLRLYGRELPASDLRPVASATAGFTGAEIASLVPEAMFQAFGEGERALTGADLLAAARTVVPLSKTAGDKLEALRQWAQGRARPASAPETESRAGGRNLDL